MLLKQAPMLCLAEDMIWQVTMYEEVPEEAKV